MSDKRTTVDVECLLRNGREIYLVLDLPRDEIREQDGTLVYTRKPEEGIIEETSIPRAEIAYMKQTTREEYELSLEGVRTLGRSLVPSS